MGLGEFGTGPFGFGGTSLSIELVLAEQGMHQIELTVETPDGAGETVARIDATPTDCVLAMRPCADGPIGAISRPITLPTLTFPAAPRLLPSTNP